MSADEITFNKLAQAVSDAADVWVEKSDGKARRDAIVAIYDTFESLMEEWAEKRQEVEDNE